MEDYILETKDLTKHFAGVTALKQVNFNVKRNEIHGLIGENGAGKSTLVKILSGIIPKSSGQIFIDGEEIKENSPSIAMNRYGINIVPQNVEYHAGMTVAENLFIHDMPFRFGFVDYRSMVRDTQYWFDKFSLDLNPLTLMENTSFVQQKIILIIKALKEKSKIIILDEPTASLTIQEIELLFNFIKDFNQQGTTFIYISHHLEEVFQICDRVTILRDGRIKAIKNIKDTTKSEIVQTMVGRTDVDFEKVQKYEAKEARIKINNFSDTKILEDISFDVGKGEILSIVGIKGCGKEELIKYIYGFQKSKTGRISIDDREISVLTPEICLKNGICFLPEDRRTLFLFVEKTIKENISFGNIAKIIGRLGFLSMKKEQALARKYKERFDIKTPSLDQRVQFLSGGNQQKVAISKAINTDPKVLILHEPTVGIDVGSRLEIHKLIEELTQSGLSIIMVSSDIDEVIRLSDRIIVMYSGKIIRTVLRGEKEFNTKDIILLSEGGEIVNKSNQ